MSVNKSVVVQRVLNELADEGVCVERGVVMKSVDKLCSGSVGVLDEDECVRLVCSVLVDGAECGVVGEVVSGGSGGILLGEDVDVFDIDDR